MVLRGGGILRLGLAASIVLAVSVPAAAQAVTLRPGDILVAHNDTPPVIGKVNPRTGNEVVVASGGQMGEPWGLIVTPNGKIVTADSLANALISINPATGAQRIVSSGAGLVFVGVGRAANGNLVASDYGSGTIFSVDPGSGARTPIASSPLLGGAAELAVAPGGRIFVPAEGMNPGVYSVNARTGAVNPLVTPSSDARIEDPYSVARAPNGRLFVADYDFGNPTLDGALFSIKPSGGALRLISSGQLFEDPIGLARSWRGPLVVAEQDNPGADGQVISVNPRTGVQRTLALAGDLHSPGGVTVVPPRCFGRFATIVGGPKGDVLKGTRFPDVIAGAGGADRISGRGGKDRICGGKGRDRLRGGAGRDRLRGGPGRDFTRQ